MIEIRDVAPGLWVWRTEHHHWRPGLDWGPVVHTRADYERALELPAWK